jgi:hypothetical protein
MPLGTWRQPGLKLRCVCEPCNNNWMSALENRVRPIVLGLIDGSTKRVHTSAHSVLAFWAVKNAMVFESLYPDRPRFYLQSERDEGRESHRIPCRTTVWLAHVEASPGAMCSARDHRGLVPTGAGDCHAYSTTMAFGPLALQVISCRVPPASPVVTADLTDGPWDDLAIPLWPPRDGVRRWPPKYGLNGEHGLEWFDERLRADADQQVATG